MLDSKHGWLAGLRQNNQNGFLFSLPKLDDLGAEDSSLFHVVSHKRRPNHGICIPMQFNIEHFLQKELDNLYSGSEPSMSWVDSSMLGRYDGKVVLRSSAQQATTVLSWNLSAEDMIVIMIRETSHYVAPVWASGHGKVLACNMCLNKQCIWNFVGGDDSNGRSSNPWDLTIPGHASHPKNCWSMLSPPSRHAWKFYDSNLWEGSMSNVHPDTGLFKTWHPAPKTQLKHVWSKTTL